MTAIDFRAYLRFPRAVKRKVIFPIVKKTYSSSSPAGSLVPPSPAGVSGMLGNQQLEKD